MVAQLNGHLAENFELERRFVFFDADKERTADSKFFDRFSSNERQAVKDAGRRMILRPGHKLFRQGTKHGGIYIVESGRIRTHFTARSGKDITLAYWGEGHFVGGPEVFGRGRHIWSGTTIEETRVLYLSGDILEDLMMRCPSVAMSVIDGLILKGRAFSNLVQLLGTRTAGARLATLMINLCETYGEPSDLGLSIGHRYTHEELASMIGVTRQWVSTTISKLRSDGILATRGKEVFIVDLARLACVIRTVCTSVAGLIPRRRS
ncbi:Crp/Fnr family transcriptional regulator [Rhizobium sp. S152]|uniref:Crp/Fnr family transcriptional regulator n=1 Tax=Rhizobium sp. S152 TaxID=3055038 RepID=UPI0025A93323|nr:Crp/Fnr family transcriptional regulator [Rhizobium sp. S152]MDM9624729.1 Crp/Fnr family transcriptional regulator [Rhizobium sp. S152]